ncbi:MAG: hypothetical protein EU536_02705 [Promethearchaeota archaeon]|nr:MAG: hypothetical protein EU536_02705 [Candidatus Lokiarchaeota archaeon]
MSVLIKDVDKELYAQFKAAAVMRGLRLNEALCKAMEYWIKLEQTKDKIDEERMLNNTTYRRLIPQLLKDHEGDWIVISKGELIGIFKNQLEAIKSVKTHNLLDRCNLVSPITAKKRKI